jgi:hypothetical protein
MSSPLEDGIEHEQEHRKMLENHIQDPALVDKIIEGIAKDHLEEYGDDYYECLEEMEEGEDEEENSEDPENNLKMQLGMMKGKL